MKYQKELIYLNGELMSLKYKINNPPEIHFIEPIRKKREEKVELLKNIIELVKSHNK